MTTERITFLGHNGDTLAARLDLPAGPVHATAVFAHCFTCSKDITAAKRIAGHLAAMNIAVLRFDFTGLGHSEGEFANTNFSSNVDDLILAAKYLTDTHSAPSLLVGHSLGGAAVLKVAAELPSVKAVATLGAPHDPAHVIHNFGVSLEEIEQNGVAKVDLAGRPFTIKKDFVDDVRASSLNNAISTMKSALLVLHSPIDQTVGIENASEIFLAAKHPKSFVTLDDTDHLITKAEDAEYAASVIASWVSRYIDIPKPAAPIGAPEGVVRSEEANKDGFLQDICSGPKHHTLADEPISYGGTDLGMSPFNFLSAGLAACTSMTIRMYARRKGWPLDHVAVDVIHDKIHAQECQSCETGEGKIDQFRRVITLEGKLTPQQRTRLMEIADKCPVHRTLHAEVAITTEDALRY
ncbi:MAG: bifunctional alpha/beta hydrolase/OsmC family protein [Pseudomonadota bacterium]